MVQMTLGHKILMHKILGVVDIDLQCQELQKSNPDTTTVFVKYNGEIREVSRDLLTWESYQPPKEKENC